MKSSKFNKNFCKKNIRSDGGQIDGGMNLNEFNAELEKFIEETVKKAVDEQTAKTIEETVRKAVAKYTLETNNQLVLLQTALNALMQILVVHRFPSTEEIKAIMTKVLEEKAKELNEKNRGEKVEKPES